jgi:hypothetical protein
VFNQPAEELNMMNEYAWKFAREAYHDAVRAGNVDAVKLAELKAEYDRQDRAYWANLPTKVAS